MQSLSSDDEMISLRSVSAPPGPGSLARRVPRFSSSGRAIPSKPVHEPELSRVDVTFIEHPYIVTNNGVTVVINYIYQRCLAYIRYTTSSLSHTSSHISDYTTRNTWGGVVGAKSFHGASQYITCDDVVSKVDAVLHVQLRDV